MKRLALFFALSAMSTAVMAQSAIPNAVQEPAVAPASGTAAMAQPAPKDEVAKKDDVANRNCLKETGSRIKPHADRKGRRCVNAPGASYNREDLDRTGANNIKDALRRLDPTVH